MGCKMAKAFRKRERKDTESPLPEPPPPEKPDPRLPLTARQKFSMVKSWKGISRAMQPTGITMFLKLFEDNREILMMFDKFKELRTRDEQAESLELAEHATIVMNSIDEGIRAMDNVDFFFDLLYQIGASHRRLPGFKKEYFWKIERPFLEAVKLTLDERYSENIEKVYKITIRFIIETVIQGYERADEREINDNMAEAKTGASSKVNLSSPTSDHSQKTVNAFRMNIKSGASSVLPSNAASKVNNTNGTAASSVKASGGKSPDAKSADVPCMRLNNES